MGRAAWPPMMGQAASGERSAPITTFWRECPCPWRPFDIDVFRGTSRAVDLRCVFLAPYTLEETYGGLVTLSLDGSKRRGYDSRLLHLVNLDACTPYWAQAAPSASNWSATLPKRDLL